MRGTLPNGKRKKARRAEPSHASGKAPIMAAVQNTLEMHPVPPGITVF